MAEHENSVGESDDWHTPKKYFDAIGLTYDLDPAHPGLGTPHCFVPVKEVYTINDDGLNQPWHGLVFCNPPYGARRGHVPWLQKLIAHNNGVGLFRAYTSADWFHDVLLPARAVLMFPRGKIKFIRSIGRGRRFARTRKRFHCARRRRLLGAPRLGFGRVLGAGGDPRGGHHGALL